MNARPLCTLHVSVGESEECPESSCAFWEEGGAAIDPACVLERARFELESRPHVARWLLKLRYDLENARSAEEMRRIRGSLNQVLPPGLHE